ncbi:MAG TPA: ABC transporter substrate-binding protein, partial [Candidatus Methylomirabilis sp.]|nr:ABC transporter substrate-binding protein [Candidatus Methylomirabilis sp.]
MTGWRKELVVVVVAALAALVVAGQREAGAAGKTLVVGLVAEPTSMDPGQLTDINSMRVLSSVYDTLVRFKDDSFTQEPGLATSWKASPDGLTYTFTLRKGVSFHDGTPFNAEAVKFTYDRLLDPKHPFADTGPFPFASFYYGAIKEVTVVDPYTVRFTLKQPFSPLLNNLTLNTGRIVSPAAVKKYGKEFASHPVGTGPFKFTSWDKNVRIVLDANPGYWGGAPKLERLVFRPLVEEQTRVTELLSGGVDFIVDVPPDNVEQVKKDPKLVYYAQPGPHIWWVTLNSAKKPFSDVRVRRAVNQAVNRDAIANDLLKQTATPAIGPVPPSITWAYTDKVTKYPYDPARAKKLLAEAGYPNGFPAVFWIPESGSGMQSPKTMAQAIQADLAAVGVTASIQTFEWGAYLSKYGKGFGQDADMAAMSFMLDPGDPAPMLSLTIDSKGGFRGGAYSNPEVDRLLAEATRTSDLKKRGELYQRVQKLVVDDAPWIF